jgi:hypothetical protein
MERQGGAIYTERWLRIRGARYRVNTVSPGSILVEGNGWDRYRAANPPISTITFATADGRLARSRK